MTPEKIQAFVSELSASYAGAMTAQDGTRTLVQLPVIDLPSGCRPASTDVLVVLTPGVAKPDLLVRVDAMLPNGARPNYTPTSIAGESWYAYSFNLQWDGDRHTAVQFVEGRLRRFALNG